MLKRALVIVVATVMPFVMGSAFLTSSRPSQSVAATERVLPEKSSQPPSTADDDEADADVLGNPVSDAVAKYKFDATGSLYELHSPQTELPRLADPKS